jgi:hypothetical protein
MRLGKRLLVVGALLCLVIVSTGVIRAAGSGNDARARETSTGYPKRAVLTDIEKWSSGCRNGFCEETDFPAVQLTTSPAIGRVDVTFTATVDFRTTRDDWGSFAAELDSDTGHRTMPPGTLRVVSPSSTLMTTTTLVWAVRRLPAQGRTYNFLLGAAGHDGDGNGVGRIYGRHVTLDAEQTRS